MYVLLLLFEAGWDPMHMFWNAAKRGLKHAKGRYWRSLLLLQVRCNYAYGPWGSGDNKYTRAAAMELLREQSTHKSDWFETNLQQICFDMRVDLPHGDEQIRTLFLNTVGAASENMERKGPHTSLGHWWSHVISLDKHDTTWTISKEAIAAFVQRRLRIRLEDADFHLITPGADTQKNDAAEVKSLRDKTKALFWNGGDPLSMYT